jgi:predicted AAA+ superfamily ATPase
MIGWEFQGVTLPGPRQSGKTTLCRAAFPEHRYANLELPARRQLARQAPALFPQN